MECMELPYSTQLGFLYTVTTLLLTIDAHTNTNSVASLTTVAIAKTPFVASYCMHTHEIFCL